MDSVVVVDVIIIMFSTFSVSFLYIFFIVPRPTMSACLTLPFHRLPTSPSLSLGFWCLYRYEVFIWCYSWCGFCFQTYVDRLRNMSIMCMRMQWLTVVCYGLMCVYVCVCVLCSRIGCSCLFCPFFSCYFLLFSVCLFVCLLFPNFPGCSCFFDVICECAVFVYVLCSSAWFLLCSTWHNCFFSLFQWYLHELYEWCDACTMKYMHFSILLLGHWMICSIMLLYPMLNLNLAEKMIPFWFLLTFSYSQWIFVFIMGFFSFFVVVLLLLYCCCYIVVILLLLCCLSCGQECTCRNVACLRMCVLNMWCMYVCVHVCVHVCVCACVCMHVCVC